MPLNPAVPVYGKTIAGANEAIGCTTPTAATQTLTFSGNAVAGETFKIGVNTYVWTSTAANISGQTPYFVLTGADAAASIVNATAAITGTASKGTLFSNNTNPNPAVTAVATSSTVLTITATAPGADGNGIALSETMTNATWGAATTLGGVSASLQVTGAGGGGIPFIPPTVNGVTVVGVQETRPVLKNAATDATYTIAAGYLAVTILFSSDFAGTVLGVAVSGASTTAYNDASKPGNTLPAIAVTRSAGTYSIIAAGAV